MAHSKLKVGAISNFRRFEVRGVRYLCSVYNFAQQLWQNSQRFAKKNCGALIFCGD